MKKELSFAAVLMMLAVCAVIVTDAESADADGASNTGYFDSSWKATSDASSAIGIYEYSGSTLYVKLKTMNSGKDPDNENTKGTPPWCITGKADAVTTIYFENFTKIWGCSWNKTSESPSCFPNVAEVFALSSGTSHFPGFGESTYTNSVGMFGYNTFFNCIELKTVAINVASAENGKAVFADCTVTGFGRSGLVHLELVNASVYKAWDYGSFERCDSLNTIVLDGVTSIGTRGFSGCPNVTKIDVSKSEAFCYDSSTNQGLLYNKEKTRVIAFNNSNEYADRSLTLADTVTSLDSTIFYGLKAKEVVIPTSINTIPNTCFDQCTKIEKITCKGVKIINYAAFRNCTSLKEVIAGDITAIGTQTFRDCTNLTKINSSDDNDVVLTSLKEIPAYAFFGSGVVSVYGPSIQKVGTYSFYECSKLETIKTSNLTSIGDCAFIRCYNLNAVNTTGTSGFIDLSKATEIGSFAFQEALKSGVKVDVSSVSILSKKSFFGSGVAHVVAGTLMNIETEAFNSCTNLKRFDSAVAPFSTNNGNGVCNIPLAVSVGGYAFCNTGITSVFAYSLNTIGESAFYNCSLSSFNEKDSFVFPSSLTAIGTSAFNKCSASSIDIPSTVSRIDASAFTIYASSNVFIHGLNGLNGSQGSFARLNSAVYTVYSDVASDKLTVAQKGYFPADTIFKCVSSGTVHTGIYGNSSATLIGTAKEQKVLDGGHIILPFAYSNNAYWSYGFGVGSNNPESQTGYVKQILDTEKSSGQTLTIHVPAGTPAANTEHTIYLWNGKTSTNGTGIELIEKLTINLDYSGFSSSSDGITWSYGIEVTIPSFDSQGNNNPRWTGAVNGNSIEPGAKFVIGWWETGFKAVVDSKTIKITWLSGDDYTTSHTVESDSGSTIAFPDIQWIENRRGYTVESASDVEWYTAKEGRGVKVVNDYKIGYTDVTFYAKYIKPADYTITIRTNWSDQTINVKGPYDLTIQSTGKLKITDSSGAQAKESNDPETIRKGYSFTYYYVEDTSDASEASGLVCNQKYLVSGSGVTGNLALFMGLSESAYSISYSQVSNGTPGEKYGTTQTTYTAIAEGFDITAGSKENEILQEIRVGVDYATSKAIPTTKDKSTMKAVLTTSYIPTGSTEFCIFFVYSTGYALDLDYGLKDSSEQRLTVIKQDGDGTVTIIPPRDDQTKPGYSFAGWKINGEVVHDSSSDFTFVEKDLIESYGSESSDHSIKLEAIWKPNTNIVTFVSAEEEKSLGTEEFITNTGKKITTSDPSRVGYTFDGWRVYIEKTATGSDTTEITVPVGGSLNLSDDFMESVGSDGKIYAEAIWKENTYTVSFSGNGAVTSFSDVSVKYNGEFTVPSSQGVAYSYYDFLNWTVDGAEGILTSNQVVQMKDYAALADSNSLKLTVKMVWNKINYKINFNTNGGISENDLVTMTVKYGEELELPSAGLTRTGYTFTGWSGTSGDDNIAYDNKNKMDAYIASLADSDDFVTLYAVWNPQSYKVSYSLGGGVFGTDAPETVYSGVEFEVGHPKRIGYKFTGWTASGSDLGDGAKYQIGQRFMAWNGESTTATVFKDLTFQNDKTVTMTANWEIADIKILYDLNGGSGTVSGGTTQGHVGMTGFQFPTISGGREGYKHAGWSIDKISVLSGFTDAVVSAADEDNIVTLYAVWTPQSYYIEFRSTDQDEYMRTEAFYDVSTELGTPERLGYTFKGWTSSDITSSQARYSMNEVVWLSWPDKSAANGSFVMNLSSQADKAVHLTATWEANSYRVVYSPNGGAGDAPKDSGTYKIGDAFELASTESLKGTYGNKILVGWATDAVATVPLALDTFVEGLVEKADRMNAVTLYAVWVEGSYTVSVDVGEAKPSAVPSGWELQDGKYVRSADYGTQTKDVLADWDSVVLEWDGHVFTGWKYDISSVITNISVTADYDEVKQWIIYAFVGIVAAVAIIAVVFTRLERW